MTIGNLQMTHGKGETPGTPAIMALGDIDTMKRNHTQREFQDMQDLLPAAGWFLCDEAYLI